MLFCCVEFAQADALNKLHRNYRVTATRGRRAGAAEERAGKCERLAVGWSGPILAGASPYCH